MMSLAAQNENIIYAHNLIHPPPIVITIYSEANVEDGEPLIPRVWLGVTWNKDIAFEHINSLGTLCLLGLPYLVEIR